MNRSLHRTSLVALTTLALVGTFWAGTTFGSDADPRTTTTRTTTGTTGATGVDVVAAAWTGSALDTGGSCQDLLDEYVARGVDRVGPWGWDGPPVYYSSDEAGSTVEVPRAAEGSDSSSSSPTTVRQTNEATGTNVQESGVDEPDVVKTDGRVLYRVDGDDLTAYDVSGAVVERLGSLDLPRMTDAEILLVGSRVVALAGGEDGEDGDEGTRVAVLDVSDPTAMTVERVEDHDSALVTARLHGSVVRLVLQAGLPDLDLAEPGRRTWGLFSDDEDDTLEANRDRVRDSAIDDWLPHVSVDGGEPEPVLACDQVGLPDEESGLGTIAVVGFDPANPDDRSATGLVADTEIAYASTDRLYLATSPAWGGGPWSGEWSEDLGRSAPGSSSSDGSSTLYSFAFTGHATTYVAAGEVDGVVRDRWSLDEADGVLRVAVGPSGSGSWADDSSSVVTMTEEGDDLVESGRVDGLGPGEDIQSVRWSADLALVVTFRQTDPLYAVDLTDPAAPRLLGELKIPGFASYLHPLGGARLVGVGEGPDEDGSGWGGQLGLFDVTDLTAPRRISLTHYGSGSVALAGSDPRQLTWLPDRRTVLTVVTDRGGDGFVSVVRLGDGAASNEMLEVEHGDEVHDVRLVPLPDGRVVLATGDDASFLAL